MDQQTLALINYLSIQAVIALITWLAIEGVSSKFTLRPQYVTLMALALGGGLACAAHFGGFLDTALVGWRDYLLSFIFGVVAAAAAAGASDHNLLTIVRKIKGDGS